MRRWQRSQMQAEISRTFLFSYSSTCSLLLISGQAAGPVTWSNTPHNDGTFAEDLRPVMDAYAWSYEAGAVKPDPAIYQHILGQLGCTAHEVLFIGDTPAADVDGPRAFGMSARLINRRAGQSLETLLAELL
jgi:methionine salvage enolase-phosphatase E1